MRAADYNPTYLWVVTFHDWTKNRVATAVGQLRTLNCFDFLRSRLFVS